jgi:hypothetical protein
VYYVLRGAIVVTNIHVHAMIGVGVEPKIEGELLNWGHLFLQTTV